MLKASALTVQGFLRAQYKLGASTLGRESSAPSSMFMAVRLWPLGKHSKPINIMNTTDSLPRDTNGKLSSWAWPGGYPIYYLDKENNCLCPDCANRDVDQSQDVIAADINWEDQTLHCDDCSKQIESAYGE